MESEYIFVTIHTLIDIGDGSTGLIDGSGNISTTANLARIVDTVLRFSHPFMTTILSATVDLSKERNKIYYRLGTNWDLEQTVFTFKFAIKTVDNICERLRCSLDGVPLVIPNANNSIDRFITTGPNKNTTIIEKLIV